MRQGEPPFAWVPLISGCKEPCVEVQPCAGVWKLVDAPHSHAPLAPKGVTHLPMAPDALLVRINYKDQSQLLG